MSDIRTQLKIIDKMSAPLYNITSSVNQVISSLQNVDGAVNQAFDPTQFDAAQISIDHANAEIKDMIDNMEQGFQYQNNFNREINEGSKQLDTFIGKLTGMGIAMAGAFGIKKLVSLSDEMTNTTARLNMINDGLQTTEELYDKIFASAQRARADFAVTADTVAKLEQRAGAAFGSNDEAILFAENLNKQFVIAGASQAEMQSAALQLTQALGSGVLRGDELNSVFEAAPNIIQTIADYMNIPIGEIRALASEGKITANTVKNAMLAASDTINQQFEQMPMTWAQVATMAMNNLLYAAQPLLNALNFMAQYWEVFEPLVIAGAIALGLYTAALMVHNTVNMTSSALKAIHSAHLMLVTSETFKATAAQYGFNAALLACPLTWIIGGIIAIIAIIYFVIAVINKTQDTTISATGVIIGAVYSVFAFLWNIVSAFINFFANVWIDPVGAIARLFGDLADSILGLLELIAKGIDTVFGSNLQNSVSGWRSSLVTFIEDKFGKGIEIIPKIDYMEAYDTGYGYGKDLDNQVKTFFGSNLDMKYGDYFDNMDYNIGDIAANTGSVANTLTDTKEDLKYLKDIAEREVINRFTTAEIKINQTNNNSISSDMDIDGVLSKFNKDLTEILETAAEGVH